MNRIDLTVEELGLLSSVAHSVDLRSKLFELYREAQKLKHGEFVEIRIMGNENNEN